MTLLAYLADVCIMPYLAIGNVSGSVSFAMIAVLTVSYGKKAAFVSGAVVGILMETMLASVPALYVIAYPVIATLCAQFFADMSDRQRERRRTSEKPVRQDDLPALLRIPLCAALSGAIFSAVLIVYGYLAGYGLTIGHFTRSFFTIAYTCAIAVIIMLPVRYFLGIYGTRKERKQKRGEQV